MLSMRVKVKSQMWMVVNLLNLFQLTRKKVKALKKKLMRKNGRNFPRRSEERDLRLSLIKKATL